MHGFRSCAAGTAALHFPSVPKLRMNDLLLHYEDVGAGEPILLLHGSLSTGREAFGALMPLLSPHYRLLCPDMRGHGQTCCTARSWTIPQLARDMIDFTDALGFSSVHVLGHSMGGDVAMTCASQVPERWRTITSIGSGGRPDPELANRLQLFGPGQDVEQRYPHFIRHLKEAHRPAHNGDWKAFLRMTIDNCTRYPDFSRADLERIRMPFLLVHGSRDTLVSQEDIDLLKELCPQFTNAIIRGAGHSPQMAERFCGRLAEILIRFMRKQHGKF